MQAKKTKHCKKTTCTSRTKPKGATKFSNSVSHLSAREKILSAQSSMSNVAMDDTPASFKRKRACFIGMLLA